MKRTKRRQDEYPRNGNGHKRSRREEPVQSCDDQDGHYLYRIGESLRDEYIVEAELGEGTFGKVVKCSDRQGRSCAIKIVRSIEKYREAANIEIDILNRMRRRDPENKSHIIRLLDDFDFRNHVCLVFEVLGLSLYEFMRSNSFRPFPPNQLKTICRQSLEGVEFLHRNMLTHTDLKPENILLVDSSYDTIRTDDPDKPLLVLKNCNIKIIDLGSATFDWDHHTRIVTTRHYRPPEVLLELGWSHPCDIWSLGCIFLELGHGQAMFQTHDNLEHLAMMQQTLGKIPLEFVRDTTKQHYFDDRGQLRWPEKASSSSSIRYVQQNCPPLDDWNSDKDLIHLVRNMLHYIPADRPRASEALKFRWFEESVA